MTHRVLATKQAFTQFVSDMEAQPGYVRPKAFAVGLAHTDACGNLLDAYFPFPNFRANFGTAAVLQDVLCLDNGYTGHRVVTQEEIGWILQHFAAFSGDKKRHENIEVLKALHATNPRLAGLTVIVAFIAEDDPGPVSVPEIYLRLHLLSHRLVLPNTIGVSPGAIMSKLPNVAWTSDGPVAVSEIGAWQFAKRLRGETLRVYGVDKLPHMTDYVVPPGVRIADSARVRLGAYVGDGTTVMPSGFINFNAGTRGKAMIEGRVSQGVIVGNGSDLGGAASIQGTMSGGSKVVVEIGDRTLVGALAGLGISLGDDCIVAAGVYVMPSTIVFLIDKNGKFIRKTKAYKLSGENGLLFVRGTNGRLEARPNDKAVELNPILHKN